MPKKLLSICALVITAALAGCQTPPPAPSPVKEPLIVKYESDVDPVHVRDPSVSHIAEHRGGAALRQEDDRQVLWGAHYEGVTVRDAAGNIKAGTADASGNDKASQGKDASDVNLQGGNAKGKDASIYSKKPSSQAAKP